MKGLIYMGTENNAASIIIAGLIGLIGKIVWDWLNRNNSNSKSDNPSPIVSDWGTITYLKAHLPQLVERMDKMTAGLDKIEEKAYKIHKDNSVTDEKTGRRLIYVPPSLIEDMSELKEHSVESNVTLKLILDTLNRFFTINSESLDKQNQALNKQNEILLGLRLSVK